MASDSQNSIMEDASPVSASADPWQPQKYHFDGGSTECEPRCARRDSGYEYSMMLYNHGLSSSQDTEDDDMEFGSIYSF